MVSRRKISVSKAVMIRSLLLSSKFDIHWVPHTKYFDLKYSNKDCDVVKSANLSQQGLMANEANIVDH